VSNGSKSILEPLWPLLIGNWCFKFENFHLLVTLF